MDTILENIWITGATSGIGYALSERYAKKNVTLGLVGRHISKLNEIAQICRDKGATVFTYVVDVTHAENLRIASNDFIAKTGHIDLVIANAGIRLVEDDNLQD